MSNYLKKLTLSILASLVLLFSFAPYFRVNAQATAVPPTATQWYNQDYFSWFNKVYDPNTSSEIFGERYTAAQVQWVIYGLFAFIMNSTGNAEVLSCVLSNTANVGTCTDAIKNLISSIPQVSNVADNNKSIWSSVFADRPISGIGYVREKVNNFKLVPEVKAQTVGFGFSALSPIQDLWRASRNIAFGLFVLVSIIFAFMIMFRVKINPQTVITVQSAIPKIITALILVTFSYAIAGFLIDLMYIVIGIISIPLSSFSTASGNLDPKFAFNFLVYGQPLGTVQIGIFGFLLILVTPMFLALIILVCLVALTGAVPLLQGVWLLLIPLVVVAIMIIWISMKTIWTLFKAFANIILSTIFAPFQIALGVLIPNFGFGQWVKSYISQLSIFVVTGVIGYMSLLFMVLGVVWGFKAVTGGVGIITALLSVLGGGAQGLGSWAAGMVVPTGPWPPLLGQSGIWIGILFLGVSFVLFTMIPKATELVASFLSGKPFAYGSAIGEMVGVGKAVGGFGLGYGFGKYEEVRADIARKAGVPYEPHPVTQGLRTIGVLKK